MQSVSAIALSGMNAALFGLGSAAHNIANLGTEGFRRELVSQNAVDGGGVSTTVGRAPFSGAELERDVVAQLTAKNAFLMNLTVFRASDAMMGSLLSICA